VVVDAGNEIELEIHLLQVMIHLVLEKKDPMKYECVILQWRLNYTALAPDFTRLLVSCHND
jgi:hypothetical protein